LARAEPGSANSLVLRTLSALVLAPAAVAAVWFGWPWLPLVTAAAGAVMAWEWARLCSGSRLRASGIAVIGVALATIAVAALTHRPLIAGSLSLCGAACVWGVARRESGVEPVWLALGTLWIALPCVLFLWLADDREAGRVTVLWMFAIVWSTDIGGYAFGRLVGGPRLAPRWSPRKTWAGLIGGACCAALVGWAAAGLLGLPMVLPLVLLSAGLAIVEQFGDLAESVAKRRFGVKDTSALIPGHGGLLDRLDGLLAVIPAVALLSAIGGGSVLEYR
jgi:phosphatidate cytidylyltransferase